MRKSNDNAHVEEKNRSSGPQLVSEMRLNCPDLRDELEKLCDAWSDFRNFFYPCKMLLAKEKRPDRKGFHYRYDASKTSFQQRWEEGPLTLARETVLRECCDRLRGMELYRGAEAPEENRRLQGEFTAANRSWPWGGPAGSSLPLAHSAGDGRPTPGLPTPFASRSNPR